VSPVDVIVPRYLCANFLRECVESVLTQQGVDVRVLILDDPSLKNTLEVEADFACATEHVRFVRHAVDKGQIRLTRTGSFA
jgi:glycosyltransferase involved in cell wall biosynthesis